MKHILLLFSAALGLVASAAHAERLELDHRIYPPLNAAMDNQHDGTIFYDASQRGRVFDRILVVGTSAETNWTEALELLITPRNARARTPAEWYSTFRPKGESLCPGKVTMLGQDETSLTFSLEAPACAAGPSLTGLYRVVYGRKTVYLVGAKYKGEMNPQQRDQWLALLASARLAG